MLGRNYDEIGCVFGPILIAGSFFWLGWLLSAMQIPFENVLVGMGAAIIMWALFVFAVVGRD